MRTTGRTPPGNFCKDAGAGGRVDAREEAVDGAEPSNLTSEDLLTSWWVPSAGPGCRMSVSAWGATTGAAASAFSERSGLPPSSCRFSGGTVPTDPPVCDWGGFAAEDPPSAVTACCVFADGFLRLRDGREAGALADRPGALRRDLPLFGRGDCAASGPDTCADVPDSTFNSDGLSPTAASEDRGVSELEIISIPHQLYRSYACTSVLSTHLLIISKFTASAKSLPLRQPTEQSGHRYGVIFRTAGDNISRRWWSRRSPRAI